MEDSIWTFEQGDRRIKLIRRQADDGLVLAIHGDGAPRSYRFGNLADLVRFQSDMEAFLLKTGWTFLSFSPERRTGRDRRGFPRVDNDRRRWWTDGTSSPAASAQRRSKSRR